MWPYNFPTCTCTYEWRRCSNGKIKRKEKTRNRSQFIRKFHLHYGINIKRTEEEEAGKNTVHFTINSVVKQNKKKRSQILNNVAASLRTYTRRYTSINIKNIMKYYLNMYKLVSLPIIIIVATDQM